ncbi:MAG: hypothetical protein ACLVJH_08140 [Faecalibacterium prausnitzii]
MRWYEYKMEVDDLTAPDDLKAKLLAMTDTPDRRGKGRAHDGSRRTADRLHSQHPERRAKKKKPIHFPVKQLGTLAACLAVCAWVTAPCYLGIGMGSAKAARPPCAQPKVLRDSSAASVAAGGVRISSTPRWTAPHGG